jgi:hypothetical protein
MLATLRGWRDQLLGRGSAAITVPVMDGALKPNRALDDAAVVAELPGLDDVASDGRRLYASAGSTLWRLDGDAPVEVRRFDAAITAIALSASGQSAVALAGQRVLALDDRGAEIARLDALGADRLHAVNALAYEGEETLLISDGSLRFAPPQWCHDLMSHGRSGRVARWRFGNGGIEPIAQDQHYAFGVLAQGGAVLHSESWRHRVLRTDAAGTRSLVAELPGYPSRLAAAGDGGFWLTCFVCRTQLVEFVLREETYRRRMVAEIDPRYWIAPALSSGQSFLEPLQGAGVKSMGVLKPWAPPRSYGLVIRVAADGRIERSLHSLVDGRHHGITAVAEHGGALYAASKGSGRLLKVALA